VLFTSFFFCLWYNFAREGVVAIVGRFLWIIKKAHSLIMQLISLVVDKNLKTTKTSNVNMGNTKFSLEDHKHTMFLPKNIVPYTTKGLLNRSGRQFFSIDFLPVKHDHSKYINQKVLTVVDRNYLTNSNYVEFVPENKEHKHDYYLKEQKILFEKEDLEASKGIGYKVINNIKDYPNNKYVLKVNGEEYTGFIDKNLFFFNRNYYRTLHVQEVKYNYLYSTKYAEVMKLKKILGNFVERDYALYRLYLNNVDLMAEIIDLNYDNGNLLLTKDIGNILPGSSIGFKIQKEYLGRDIWLIDLPKSFVKNIMEVFNDRGQKKTLELVSDREKFEYVDEGICVRGINSDEEIYYIVQSNVSSLLGEYEIKDLVNGYIVVNSEYYDVKEGKAVLPVLKDTINSVTAIETLFEMENVFEKSKTYLEGSMQPSVISEYTHEHPDYSQMGMKHRYSAKLTDVYNETYEPKDISPRYHMHENLYINKIIANDIFVPKNFSIDSARGIQDHDLKYKLGIFRYNIKTAYNKVVNPIFNLDLYKSETKGQMYLPNLSHITVNGIGYNKTVYDYNVPLKFSINASLRQQIEACMAQSALNVSIYIIPESFILQKIQQVTGQKDLYIQFLMEPIKSQMVVNRLNVSNSDYNIDGKGYISPSFTIGTMNEDEIFKAIGSYRTKSFSDAIYKYSFEYNQEQLNHLGYSFGQFENNGFSVYNFGLPFTAFVLIPKNE